MVYPLYELKPGERAEIVWVISEPSTPLRLEGLGFATTAQVACILKRRHDHMSAYQIQGTITALRPQNAREVPVRVLNPG